LPLLSPVLSSSVSSEKKPSDGKQQSNGRVTLWDRLRMIPPQLLFLGIGILLLGWAYWPNLQELYAIWDREPNYSHGKLVIPIALVILWQRLTDAKVHWTVGRGAWWSWLLFGAVLVLRAVAYERNNQWLETATLVPAVGCLMLTLGGWPLLSRGWPAVFFLIFMLTLPPSINNSISLPLQRIATMGSVFLLQLTGLRVIAEGNIIAVPDAPVSSRILEVAQACNGLSMLMTLAATVTATIILIPLSTWKRVVIFASALPIALISNMIRIVATGWCYYLISGEGAKKFAHDWAGFLMMPLALILVGLEVLLLSWLADENPNQEEEERPVLAVFPNMMKKPMTPAENPIDGI
jgi:exosortase